MSDDVLDFADQLMSAGLAGFPAFDSGPRGKPLQVGRPADNAVGSHMEAGLSAPTFLVSVGCAFLLPLLVH